jgi:HEAT repeat protein
VRKTAIVIWAALALFCPTAPAQTASLDELLAQTARWQSDTSRQPLLALSQMVLKARGSAPQTREMEQRFIAFLKSDATAAGKDFICKQLSLMGSEASVPVLSGMLADSKTADMGRYALERIPGPGVDRALREALAKSTGKTRIGIINTLGQRGDAASVAALRAPALGSQPAEAAAALFALAKIADPAAIEVLAAAQGKTGEVRASAAEAYLQAANRLAEHGSAAAALPIYRKLYAAGEQGTVRAAALRGLAAAGGAQAVPVLMEALRGDDAGLQAVAIGALAQSAASQLMAEIPRLNEAGQVRALGVLAERGDSSALPSFTAGLKSTSKAVRIAALDGIGRMGDASAVPAVAGLAASGDGFEQTAARASLVRIHGKDADRAVSDTILTAETKVKLELIRAAGERGTATAAPALLKMARDADDEVRRASLRALRDTGSANEISGLVELVAKPVQPGDRTDTVRSLAAVLRRSDPSRISDVLAAFAVARDMETRTSLMQVMGQSGNAKVLPILRTGLQDQDAELKRAAILALTDWPDGVPIPDLIKTARTASNPAHQVLALRGALRLVGLPGTRGTPGENVQVLAEAMSLAKQVEEKRAVLALLIRFPTKEALDLASASVNDSAVSAEAKAAVARLERTVRR